MPLRPPTAPCDPIRYDDRVERRDGPQTPYEVYCYQCQATFALGTRRCVHCGGRLAHAEAQIEPGVGSPTSAEGAADESPVVTIARRMSGATLWLVFVLAAILARMCEGGG